MKTIIKIITVLAFTVQPILSAEEAEVNFVTGKVSVKNTSNPKEKWRFVKKGDKVQEGETIITGNGSAVTFIYNSSEFKISPNSTLILKELPTKDKSGSAEVTSGFAWFKLVNIGKSGFNAMTPVSTAGVRGTAFATMYDIKTKTAMNCICEGKVEVNTSAKNSPTIVEKGNGSVIVFNKPTVDTTSYKNEIVKGESSVDAMPSFEKKVNANPILKNCLSCHLPKGWKVESLMKDEHYGK